MIEIVSKPDAIILCDDLVRAHYYPTKRTRRLIEETYPFIKVAWHPAFDFALFSTRDDDRFLVADEQDLQQVEQSCTWAFKMDDKHALAQFQASFNFLSLCQKQSEISHERSTYGLKHNVGDMTGLYICEGAFVRASSMAGFAIEMHGESHCNLNIVADRINDALIKVLTQTSDREDWLSRRINEQKQLVDSEGAVNVCAIRN